MSHDPEDVLSFWLNECRPADWYRSDPELDDAIRDRFEGAWRAALAGQLSHWRTSPRCALAFLILTDQFPRNMFRGSAEAFATDPIARSVAKGAVTRRFDMRVEPPARQFFYMPLEHSEILADQDRGIRLFLDRMPDAENILHARAHREIIRRYGRFPFRNEALGRSSTQAETAFLEGGAYGAVLRELQGEA